MAPPFTAALQTLASHLARPGGEAACGRIDARISSAGTVHVYIVKPDGGPFGSLHVAEASKPERLIELLEKTISELKVPKGEALVKPAPQSRPPAAEPDSLILHLTARGSNQGSWREFPAENWIVLASSDWKKLLPPGRGRPLCRLLGHRPEAGGEKILTHFYPQTENNDLFTHKGVESLRNP